MHKAISISIILLLLLAFLGMFLKIPRVSGWTFWKYDTQSLISSLSVSAGGNYTVVGTQDGKVFLLDKNGSQLWMKPLENEVRGVSISGDGSRIIVAEGEYSSGQPDVDLYDVDGNLIWEKDLIPPYGTPRDIFISQDGNYFATGDTSDMVRFFNSSGGELWNYKLGDWAISVSVSSGGECIVAGSWDNHIYFFDKSGNPLWNYTTDSLNDVSVSSNGEYVASAGADLFFLNKDGEQLWNITSGWLMAVSVSANADYIMTGMDHSNFGITLLNKSGGKIWSWSVDSKVAEVGITGDGKFVVAGFENGIVYFIENLEPTSITCEVSTPKVSFGETLYVFGNITPPIAGVNVALTFTTPDQNTTTQNTFTTSEGTYNASYVPNKVGFWGVKASWAGDEQYMGAESPSVFFSVGETTITCELQNWQIYLGENLDISGSIQPPCPAVEVTLTYTTPNDGRFNRTAMTGSEGNYSDSFTPDITGLWKLVASWPGDAEHMGATSPEVRFLVSTVMEAAIKIARSQNFSDTFVPPEDYYYSPMFEKIAYEDTVTPPAGLNFTTISVFFTYYEYFPGLGGTITSFEITYNIGVLDGTSEGIYEVEAFYDIYSQSKLPPYPSTFLFRYEVRCKINAVTIYETSINISSTPEVKLGEAVNVTGSILPEGGPPVSGATVDLLYTKPDGSTEGRTAITGDEGTFEDSYVPDMPGTWSVNASWNGDADHISAKSLIITFDVLTDVLHEILHEGETYFVRTLANSTVSDFLFSLGDMQISFNVSGPPNTTGFCNVSIPQNFLRGNPWTIMIDGTPLTDFILSENDTHTFIYFTYQHTSRYITIQGTWIVPEFSETVLILLMAALCIAVFGVKKSKHLKIGS